jgi:3-oxoacyl-[acyl-carrier-protein] synthase II
MKMRRVCITGIGAISGAGKDCASLTRAILDGRQCFSRIDDSSFGHLKSSFAGKVSDIPNPVSVPEILKTETFRGFDRYHSLALAASSEALASASLEPGHLPDNMAILVGTCSGPMLSIEKKYAEAGKGLVDNSQEVLFARTYDGCARLLAHLYGISGLSATVVTACSASLSAIGIAFDMIRLGIADIVLVGGSDTLSPTTLAGFSGLKATSETVSAPFSRPVGLTLGEAAAFAVVEDLEHAKARNVRIDAEICGFGLSNDAYHCTSPDPAGKGQILAMERALSDSGVNTADIVYINAHGTGTEANDRTETRAIRRVFGNRADVIPVSSTKSIVGHCLGAAGCIEVIATILAYQSGVFPSTAGFSVPREGCNLDYIPDAGRKWNRTGHIMTNNFAFGGNNASMVLYPGVVEDDRNISDINEEPVVITGMGIVSPAGVGNDVFLSAVKEKKNTASYISLKGMDNIEAGIVPEFDMRRIDRGIDTRGMDRASRFACAAARLALRETTFFDKIANRKDPGFFLNCATGSTRAEADYINEFTNGNMHVKQVSVFPYVVPNSITGNVCKELMLTGHNSTFCFGAGAGLFGLGLALYAIRNNHARAMLSGAVDELMECTVTAGMQYGYVPPAEGSCIFMLETVSHAESRNAVVLGELCSIAYTTDTKHLFIKDDTTENLEKAIKTAISDAGISTEEICAAGFSLNNDREKIAVENVMKNSEFIKIDVSRYIGFPAATIPLLNIAYFLLDSSFVSEAGKNYFVAVFSSNYGTNCAAVIRRKIQ